MTRILCVLVLSIALSSASAQCEKKVDDMTGKSSITAKPEDMTGIGARGATGKFTIRVSVVYSDNATTLYMRMALPKAEAIPAGTLVYLEMGATDSLELTLVERSKSDIEDHGPLGYSVDKKNVAGFNMMKFVLTDEQIAKLKAKKITAITVDRHDYDVSSPHQSIIADMLKCLDSKK